MRSDAAPGRKPEVEQRSPSDAEERRGLVEGIVAPQKELLASMPALTRCLMVADQMERDAHRYPQVRDDPESSRRDPVPAAFDVRDGGEVADEALASADADDIADEMSYGTAE